MIDVVSLLRISNHLHSNFAVAEHRNSGPPASLTRPFSTVKERAIVVGPVNVVEQKFSSGNMKVGSPNIPHTC